MDNWKKNVKLFNEQQHQLAIHHAAHFGHPEVVELFLKNRVPPNVVNNTIDNATALHYSILSENVKT